MFSSSTQNGTDKMFEAMAKVQADAIANGEPDPDRWMLYTVVVAVSAFIIFAILVIVGIV